MKFNIGNLLKSKGNDPYSKTSHNLNVTLKIINNLKGYTPTHEWEGPMEDQDILVKIIKSDEDNDMGKQYWVESKYFKLVQDNILN